MATAAEYLEASDWAAWIPTLFEPKQFLTLTSRDYVYHEVLWHRYEFLLRKVNKELFGNHWFRRGEGLSWVMGIEPQLRGVLHIHAVWDQPQVPYKMVHNIWNRISGYAWIEPVTSHCGVADYVSKYSVKGGHGFDISGGCRMARILRFTVAGAVAMCWPALRNWFSGSRAI